ncbi:MAG: flagellar biosynthesis anti-sigma factor FlgM [Deferrisomatales bacterium]
MKIRDRYTRGVSSTGPARGRERASEAPEAAGPVASPLDRVQISDRSVAVQRARWLALNAPEVRVGLVDQIVGMIERGEYRVQGRDVVPKLIREHLTDHGI